MSDVSRDETEDALRPFMQRLRDCIQDGFSAWREFGRQAPELRAPICARTRAGFVYDHIVSKVRVVFADVRNVRIIEKRGFPELVIRNRYVIRFKKLDNLGRSRNILSRQQKLWFEQQMVLPEMPPEATKLIAGYVLDMLGTEIDRVLVTYPKSTSSIEWAINISDDGVSNIVLMPATPRQPKAPKVRSTRPKTEETKDSDDEPA